MRQRQPDTSRAGTSQWRRERAEDLAVWTWYAAMGSSVIGTVIGSQILVSALLPTAIWTPLIASLVALGGLVAILNATKDAALNALRERFER